MKAEVKAENGTALMDTGSRQVSASASVRNFKPRGRVRLARRREDPSITMVAGSQSLCHVRVRRADLVADWIMERGWIS